MLVLTRRIGELILVGDDIQLKIIDVRGDFFVGRAVRASCPRPAPASQRRDFDSPHGLRPLLHPVASQIARHSQLAPAVGCIHPASLALGLQIRHQRISDVAIVQLLQVRR
jgi:hypothetical protein